MKSWIETSFLRAASLILIWGSLNLVLLSMKDLHSSTSSELVMGLNLRPGFEVLRYQTPSVLLNIKEFLLFLSSACVVKPSDVCHDCQRTILPTDWFLSVCACQHPHGQAGVVTCRGARAAVWVPLLPEMMPIRTPLSRVRGWRSSEATIKNQKRYHRFSHCFFHYG